MDSMNLMPVDTGSGLDGAALGAFGGGYKTLVQQVIQIGGKAVMTKSFTLEQAKASAAMMIAAIALAGK